MMGRKDVAQVLKELERQGFEIVMGGKGHWKVYDGPRLITTLPATPSDPRSLLNAIATLRRAGFVWPPS